MRKMQFRSSFKEDTFKLLSVFEESFYSVYLSAYNDNDIDIRYFPG